MRSEHFEVRVCGLEDGVELAVFRPTATSEFVRGQGFTPVNRWGLQKLGGALSRERIRSHASLLLENAEKRWRDANYDPDSQSERNQRFAEEALKDAE